MSSNTNGSDLVKATVAGDPSALIAQPAQVVVIQGRKRLSDAEFTRLVDVKVSQMVAALERFTAWDVTSALRDANPSISIPHYDRNGSGLAVRDLVKTRMFNEPLYDAGVIDYAIDGQPLRFSPLPMIAVSQVAPAQIALAAPVLALNAPGDNTDPNAGANISF